jgi:hypothetical protein
MAVPLDARLPAWDSLGSTEQECVAADVAARVHGQLLAVASHEQGGVRHRVATLDVAGVTMALIPGGEVQLGWDESSGLGVSPEQLAAWRAEAEGEPSLAQIARDVFTASRTVELAPFLIELAPRSVEQWLGELDGDDLLAAIRARVVAEGFRLATDDEWEHALRAGSRTVFRWGNEWPDGDPAPDRTSFDGHRRPNAFGLQFLDDPYKVEVVDAPLSFRGGDGGSALCGGRPAPEPWMTFASAFRNPRELWHDVIYESLESGWVRRARSIT